MFDFLKSGKAWRYLQNKVRGGEINQRGNSYEQHYACNLICYFSNQYFNNLNDVIISGQRYAFVDDLYIKDANQRAHYYQLKTSKELNWSHRKGFGSLKIDFWLQNTWSKFNNEKHDLFLVVSNKSVHTGLTATLPKVNFNINVVHFPYKQTINQLLASNTPFRKNVAELCAIHEPTLDKLAAVASNIIGFWNASDKKDISLNDILLKVKNTNGSYIKYPVIAPLLPISPVLEIVLKSIPGFLFHIESDYFTWEYMTTDTGELSYNVSSKEFSVFEQKVIQAHPTSFEALEPFLN